MAASGGEPIAKTDIAKKAGCAVRTVDRAVRRLRDEGLVEPAANHDAAGGQVGNSYCLVMGREESPGARIRPDP